MVAMPQFPRDRVTSRWFASLLLGAAGCTTMPLGGGVVAHRPAHPQLKAPAPALPRVTNQQLAVVPEAAPIEKAAPVETSAGREPIAEAAEIVVTSAALLEAAERAVAEPLSEPPPAPEPFTGYTLTLGNVLHLADAQNPNVAFARERINEAYARVERAETLWLPSLRAGLNYNHHEGAIQDVAGTVFNTNRSSFYGGLGANAVGAGSPAVPGLVAQFHLSDAIFQPKIAEHQASARQFGAAAARNDVLRDAAVAYLELVRAEHAEAIAQEALDKTQHLADITRQFAETGQGLQSDHQRLEAEVAVRQEQLVARQEGVQVASARLAQLLHADPSVVIHSGEPVVVPLEILDLDGTAASYVATGLQRRPELAEQKHLVCEAVERLRRERYAPLVPSVLLGMSYGGLGGGLGSSIINTDDRWDADAVAYWEIRNLGFGDRAARAESASVARQAQHREIAVLDRIAREVTEAHTQVVQRRQRTELARNGIVAAERSYDLNLQRIQNAQGLPIEALQAIAALAIARQSYLNAVIDYNIAQFELSRAIGWFVNG
jgi:outer membrane protein TolC